MENEKEKLQSTWNFWLASRKEENHHIKYSERLVDIAEISSIRDFFQSYLFMKKIIDIERNNDIALFKNGYKPTWESCPKSACLFIRFKKSDDPKEINSIWERLLLALIGEQFNNQSILGGILSIRGRETIIELWFNYSKDENVKMDIVCKMKKYLQFNDSLTVYFKDNELSIQHNSTIRDAQTFNFVKKIQ